MAYPPPGAGRRPGASPPGSFGSPCGPPPPPPPPPPPAQGADAGGQFASPLAFYDGMRFDFEASVAAAEEERDLLLTQHRAAIGKRPDAQTSLGKGKHSVVCRHWLKGMCMKADFCDFLHQLDYRRMPACRQQQRSGYCSDMHRGNCYFRHEATAGEATFDSFAVASILPTSSASTECLHYFLGFCKAGTRCRKSHVPRERKELPEFLPDWFLDTVVANMEVFPSIMDEGIRGKLLELGARTREVCSAPSAFNVDGSRRRKPGGPDVPPAAPLWTQGGTGHGIPALRDAYGLPPQPQDVIRAFIIKCNQMNNILISVMHGIWATGKYNTHRLCEAFRASEHVVLLFSANESGGFQGYGRMMSLPVPHLHSGVWGAIGAKLGGNFRVQWIKQCNLTFDELGQVTNPMNENLPLKKSRDGTELPLDLAEGLCRLMDSKVSEDLLEGTPYESKPRINHSTHFTQLAQRGELGPGQQANLVRQEEIQLLEQEARRVADA
eukprot:GHVT01056558.1.p1 GENE.GHVT01056558.1~~GHVT01056558.1.p1  ORF type:complete len:495 (-),score=114.52 GHVT01056558.1:371-1855(-)